MGKQDGSCLRQYFQPSTRDSLGTMGNFIISPFAWLYTALAQIVLMHAVDLHWLGWSWPSWRQQPLQDYYTADRRQSNVRVIKEAGWPNTKGLDIWRNHSLWNVTDGRIPVGGVFFLSGYSISVMYVYFFIIIIAIIVFFFKISPLIELKPFFKRILTLLILHIILLINKEVWFSFC